MKFLRLDFEAFTCHLCNIYEPVNDTFGVFAKGGIWEKHCYEEVEFKGDNHRLPGSSVPSTDVCKRVPFRHRESLPGCPGVFAEVADISQISSKYLSSSSCVFLKGPWSSSGLYLHSQELRGDTVLLSPDGKNQCGP